MGPVGVGIAGLGVVGSGTVNVLTRNADEISRRAGRDIRVVIAAVRDLDRQRDCDVGQIELTTDPMKVATSDDVEVVIELMGGEGIALDVVMAAIKSGKHVVTANKALIASHGNEIFKAAQDAGVTVAFEPAVAGGIPIIKAIREGLAGNRVEWLAGIINGTSNFILTAMADGEGTFEDVLARAQELGYAEADPTFDVEGVDAAHKLTILASIAFGIPLQFDKVYVEGISSLAGVDVDYARELGFTIKHLGMAVRRDQGIELRVHPTLIPQRRLIANVDGVMNAVLVCGDAVGQTLHYGAGAGADATASAVVADIVDVVRALTTDPDNRVPHLAFQPGKLADLPILDVNESQTAYYIRIAAVNRPGVLAEVTRVFGDSNISIETILQKGSGESEQVLPIILLTQRTIEKNIDRAIEQLEALDDIVGSVVRLRVEHLNG